VANHGKDGNVAWNDAGRDAQIRFTARDVGAATTYLRTDGQDIASNPALHQQFELDRAICQTEPGDDRDCMAVKGYVSVSKDQAAAKQQQLAAIAAENAKHETVSEPPALRPATSSKTLTARKQTAKPPAMAPTASQD